MVLVSKINATYSITQDKINNDGSIDIDLSPVLMFMAYDASTYGMSFGSTPKLNLSLKNETGKKLHLMIIVLIHIVMKIGEILFPMMYPI